MNFYVKCAKVLQQVQSKKANFKTILFNLKKKIPSPQEFQKLYSIILNTMNNLKAINSAIELLQTQKVLSFKNLDLVRIMIYELIYGKFQTIKGGGQIKKYLMQNQQLIRACIQKETSSEILTSFQTPADSSHNSHPTNQLSKKKILRSVVYLRLLRNNLTADAIKEQILRSMPLNDGQPNDSGSIMIDEDGLIPKLLKLDYNSYKLLKQLNNFEESKDYIVQSKSSCMPPYFLLKNLMFNETLQRKRIHILDACSAPGNKTSQLADYCPNSMVFAIEKDPKRFALLKSRMNFHEHKNITFINSDFLKLDPLDKRFQFVRYIMVDPSCSGSGMLNQLENQFQKQCYEKKEFEKFCGERYERLEEREKERVIKLSQLQLSLLNHALKFPRVIKIIYSTCSLYEMENENVVRQFLEQNTGAVRLVNLSKFWGTHAFSVNFAQGSKCLRADPVYDETDGFFLALFKILRN